jgi:hypothetical protein
MIFLAEQCDVTQSESNFMIRGSTFYCSNLKIGFYIHLTVFRSVSFNIFSVNLDFFPLILFVLSIC